MTKAERGQWTRHLIREQGAVWEAAAAQVGPLPAGPVLLAGSGSSYYVALTAAAVARRLGLSVSARPAGDIVTEPEVALSGQRALVVVSRSGHTSEAVWAAEAAQQRGLAVVALTCHSGAALTRHADVVWAAEDAEDATVVMIRSFTTLLVMLQAAVARTARLDMAPLSDAASAWSDWRDSNALGWLDAPAGGAPIPRRAVMLGGGIRLGVAWEGMLKATEMSNQVAHAYAPLEYRHGPWGSLAEEDVVFVLAQRATAAHDRQLVVDLCQRTPLVVAVGPEGWDAGQVPATVRLLSYPAAVDDRWAGPLVAAPLQAFSWWWAMASGRDPDAPESLTSVVKLDA